MGWNSYDTYKKGDIIHGDTPTKKYYIVDQDSDNSNRHVQCTLIFSRKGMSKKSASRSVDKYGLSKPITNIGEIVFGEMNIWLQFLNWNIHNGSMKKEEVRQLLFELEKGIV